MAIFLQQCQPQIQTLRQWEDVGSWETVMQTPGEVASGDYTFTIWANSTQGTVEDVQFRITIYIGTEAGVTETSQSKTVTNSSESATRFDINFDIENESFNYDDKIEILLEYSGGDPGENPTTGGNSTEQIVVLTSSVEHPAGIGDFSINHYQTNFNQITVEKTYDRVFVQTQTWSTFGESDIDAMGWTLEVFSDSSGNQGMEADFDTKSSQNGSYEATFYWYYNRDGARSDAYKFVIQTTDIQGNTWEVMSDGQYLEIDDFEVDEETEYENPELELKFNLKEENDGLSPQNKLPGEVEATKTVMAQYDDYIGFKTNREPVDVGTWTSEPVEFDLSISIKSFDIWWEVMGDGDYDPDCEWTITILHNEEYLSEDTSSCQHDGEELEKGSHNLDTSINLAAGDAIGINLVYEGWEDIKIYYDNITYDTGLDIAGGHVFFFGGEWAGSEVNIEFAEAWPVNWNTNLDGGFVMIKGADGYMADNSKANVGEGNEYTIQMANGSSEITSTIITWTEITGTGIQLMMDYTTFDHMPGNNSANGTAKPALVTLTLKKTVPEEEPGNQTENEKKEDEEEKCVDGDTKIAEDGCNQCICSNEEWACTEVDCNPDDNPDDSNISVPSVSLISSIAAIGIIALRRRY
jgi:hypothetical protein